MSTFIKESNINIEHLVISHIDRLVYQYRIILVFYIVYEHVLTIRIESFLQQILYFSSFAGISFWAINESRNILGSKSESKFDELKLILVTQRAPPNSNSAFLTRVNIFAIFRSWVNFFGQRFYGPHLWPKYLKSWPRLTIFNKTWIHIQQLRNFYLPNSMCLESLLHYNYQYLHFQSGISL